ncbi:hypothetical protein AAC387_Pa05g1916 [Persea americana]
MGIHVLAAKLPFMHIFKLSPLLWPFNLYLPVLRHLQRVCQAFSDFSAFFAFRLRQILTVHQEGRDTRWERAMRLFYQEFMPHQRPDVLDDSSIQTFLSLSL